MNSVHFALVALCASTLLAFGQRPDPAASIKTSSDVSWLEELVISDSKVFERINTVATNTLRNPNTPLPPLRSDVAQRIADLGKETTQESLDSLFHDDLFLLSGVRPDQWPTRSELPLHPSVGSEEMARILGNRRFLKIYDELGKLPPAEAARLINTQLERLLEAYIPLFERKASEMLASGSINVVTDVQPDPRLTLFGSRQAILGLVWITGNLRLEETRPVVLKVLNLAVAQRDKYYAVEDSSRTGNQGRRGIGRAVVSYASLYHRQILVTGLVGVSGEVADSEALLRRNSVSWVSARLTKYDAHITALEPVPGGLPVDYSKGTLPVQCASDLDDRSFDAIRTVLMGKQPRAPGVQAPLR